MGSITDYMYRVQELTNKNLKILNAINDSFYSKKDHISVVIDGKQYILPSFLELESKIDSLSANLESLIDIRKTGVANMTFDGTSQRVQLMGYSNVPDNVSLDTVSSFFIDNTDVFKDFMTPTPYIKVGLPSISDNCTSVVVRKIAFKSSVLSSVIESLVQDGKISWADVSNTIDGYVEDVDYVMYDTERRLPHKHGAPQAVYTISKVNSQDIDDNFEEHYSLELNEDLSYFIEDGTVERTLQVGDTLLTNNDVVKLLIEEVTPGSKTIKVKVVDGAYSELNDVQSSDEDRYKLHFYRYSDYSQYKYIDVPLEEDRKICVFVAVLNNELNIRSDFGTGIILDVDSLSVNVDGEVLGFREYYEKYVNNIGDTLFSITSMFRENLDSSTYEEFSQYVNYSPQLTSDKLTVTQINKHLNDSKSVKEIRRLYDQKASYKSELETVKSSIDNLNSMISNLSFDDTSNSRSLYASQLSEQNAKKIELSNSIASVSQDIAQSANSSDVPIENAKYHIRGWAPIDIDGLPDVVKVDIEYRYKNVDNIAGNASTIGDSFIFSDWNRQQSFNRAKLPSNNGFAYSYSFEADNSNLNEPSFNQIDIPISQGESVDIRYRLVYSLGWPFIETRSAWSSTLNVEFPKEYVKNVDILDIIEENNNDVKSYQFESILESKGVNSHVSDRILDQENTYFHKAENIASGFYTSERRVIPLKDKLDSLDYAVNAIQAEISGQNSDNIIVSVSDGVSSVVLSPYIDNNYSVTDYTSNDNKTDEYASTRSTTEESSPGLSQIAYEQLSIQIYNGGEYNAKLFTMFPGSWTEELPKTAMSRFSGSDYSQKESDSTRLGVHMQNANGESLQTYNQTVYFRMNNPFTDDGYYDSSISTIRITDPDSKLMSKEWCVPETWASTTTSYLGNGTGNYFMTVFPNVVSSQNICVKDSSMFLTLRPGESMTIPLSVYYWFSSASSSAVNLKSMHRTISFDIRTSLYQDPVNYKLTICADYTRKISKKVKSAIAEKNINNVPYQSVIVRSAASSKSASSLNKSIK